MSVYLWNPVQFPIVIAYRQRLDLSARRVYCYIWSTTDPGNGYDHGMTYRILS